MLTSLRLAGFTSMVLLVGAASPSQAQAPTYAAQLTEAQATLSRATAEKDPARQPDVWLQAARQFSAMVPRKDISDGQRCDAVFNMLVAFRNSVNIDVRIATKAARIDDPTGEPKPQAIPERDQQVLGLVDTYLGAVACHKADTTAELLFFKANVLRRFAHNREAMPLYLEIIDKHRQHEVAEYAVNLLLDLYNRAQQYDELIALAARISSDSAFLAKKDDLRARLTMINNVAARKSAEALERTAAASKAPADFTKAADAYFQLFKQMRNAKPPGDGAAEVLYNAGVAYESASDTRRAVECYRLLLREQPASKMHGRAMRQLGAALGTLAMPSEAADALEMYATRYGAERDAVDALADAFTYRRAAGDDAKAIATAQKLIKLFGNKRPADAAAAQLAIADIYQRRGDKPAALKSLRAYLTQFGSRGDAGKDITVQRNIGELEWALSCPVATVDGLCMQLSKVKAPLTCASRKPVALGEAGVPARPRYQMVKRKAEHVKAAMAAFSAAQQLAQRFTFRVEPSDAPRSTPLFNTPDDTPKPYDIATAQRMLAEPEFEAFWALQFPRNLNFDPAQPKVAAAAQKVFTAWLTESTQRSTALRTKYQQVLSLKDPANTFAAMARLGQLADKFSYELTNGDIPASLRAGEFGEEKVTAYCETMQEQATALTANAEQAYAACVAKAAELAWRDASTDVCQRELTRLNPKAAPPNTERRGPAVPSAVTSPEGAAVPGSGANERTLGAGR